MSACTVGAETIVSALEAASRDPQVRAIVLRVSSAGGSATAADVIARQVVEVQNASQWSVRSATSPPQGYYVAAPCAVIFGLPSTITGSIGIFGGKVDASGLLDFLRVRRLSFQRGSHSDAESPFRPYSEAERENLREALQQGYRALPCHRRCRPPHDPGRSPRARPGKGGQRRGSPGPAPHRSPGRPPRSHRRSPPPRWPARRAARPALFTTRSKDQPAVRILTVLPNFLDASAADPQTSLASAASPTGPSTLDIEGLVTKSPPPPPRPPPSALLPPRGSLQTRLDPEPAIDQGPRRPR